MTGAQEWLRSPSVDGAIYQVCYRQRTVASVSVVSCDETSCLNRETGFCQPVQRAPNLACWKWLQFNRETLADWRLAKGRTACIWSRVFTGISSWCAKKARLIMRVAQSVWAPAVAFLLRPAPDDKQLTRLHGKRRDPRDSNLATCLL